MIRLGWLVVSILLLVCVGIGVLVVMYRSNQAPPSTDTVASSTPVLDPAALAIYTSGEYGFSFFYPTIAEVSDAYTASTTNALEWRAGATAKGMLITRVRLPEGEVRIGTSNAERETQSCAKAGPAEKSLGTMLMGSTTWNRFSFEKVGTDKESRVTSYRSIHNAQCFAVEVFTPLSPTTPLATSTSFGLNDIVQSFTFAN